ncbi:AIM24 family protein [Nocardioides sp. AE5]|uniref:AIM24 family protein n=1 Tax=Nocardioides sp. AE5 TaxID=2962573 RepID=UPI002881F5E7|nr:AIM24 family protein [Nocardioides sp. AE5]MDT0200474.1 AIM24 family protein [Nocardioides sp. AE5]
MLSSDLLREHSQGIDAGGLMVRQTPRMLRASIGPGELLARPGTIVALQGSVTVEHEALGLIRISGHGTAYLAEDASEVHLIDILDDRLCVSAPRILALTDTLSWDVEPTCTSPVISDRPLTMILSGTGQVAVQSRGTPVHLQCDDGPVLAAPKAVVCWSADLIVSLCPAPLGSPDPGAGGHLVFSGSGGVLVQPAEVDGRIRRGL